MNIHERSKYQVAFPNTIVWKRQVYVCVCVCPYVGGGEKKKDYCSENDD